ncbi:MAG TPA: septal ring lytic transglycosylase RlpA family protein [Solirubrobacteraceae bacterium]|nr:septal ring lytic transglycosylase RlpA family protein [Solirubrobacteraceae bacterium]
MRRRIASSCAVLALAAGPGPTAAAAEDDAGGSAAPAPAPSPTAVIPATGGAVMPAPGQPVVQPPAGAMLRRIVRVRGLVAPGDAGREVTVEVDDATTGWRRAASTHARADGSFSVRWRPRAPGRRQLRAVLEGADAAEGAATTPVTVYRRDKATWYGPGFFGRRTACGQTLAPETLGVAHKTLPCGTPVELFYAGRVLAVEVIDRGPYANGATWDLSQATAQALGIDGTVFLGAAVVGAAPADPADDTPPEEYPSGQAAARR